MDLRKQLLTNNDCYKAGATIVPKGIMVHSTGANNPRISRYVAPNDGHLGVNTGANDWNRSGTNACVHAFIGQLSNGNIATYQTLPWDQRGWQCGSGQRGSGNNTHISFEICEDGLVDTVYFEKVYQEAVDLCAYLSKKYDFAPLDDGVIICHSEGYARGIATNHADVMHWFSRHGKTMDQFRQDVSSAVTKTSGSGSGFFLDYATFSRPLVSLFKATATAVSTEDHVNVRISPTGLILRTVNKGNRFEIDGQILENCYHVNVAGTIGYINAKYVKIDTARTVSQSSMKSSDLSQYPIIKRGATGEYVKIVQTKIGFKGSDNDGIFGAVTEAGVMAFQKIKKLTVDGIVGPQTWAALLK